MERTLRLRRAQAKLALWGGLLAFFTTLVAIGFTESATLQMPITTLAVMLLGWGLRGEVGLLEAGILPGLATIGWLLVGPALLALLIDSPALAMLTALVCAGLPLWLFRRVHGGGWIHRLHTVLFAAPTQAEMDAVLERCIETVRNRSERIFPGGFSIAFAAKPGILRINGSCFQTSTSLSQTQDFEGARALMSLVTDEVTKVLGRRAWPTGTSTCHVAVDSAHTTLRRAATRSGLVGFVETEGAPVLGRTAPLEACA